MAASGAWSLLRRLYRCLHQRAYGRERQAFRVEAICPCDNAIDRYRSNGAGETERAALVPRGLLQLRKLGFDLGPHRRLVDDDIDAAAPDDGRIGTTRAAVDVEEPAAGE